MKALRQWWDNPRIPISPRTRLRAAWIALALSLILWPLSALTWAAREPQFILGLSFLAITITAIDVILTADVREEQEGNE